MINLKYISGLKEELDKKDERCRHILDAASAALRDLDSRSSEVLKASKVSINDSLNGRFDLAGEALENAVKKLEDLDKDVSAFRRSLGKEMSDSTVTAGNLQNVRIDSAENIFSSAAEECLEAKLLYMYLSKKGKVEAPKEKVFSNLETYVGGLCDMCGELLRKAKLDVISERRDTEKIKTYYADVKEIYDTLSSFAFSNRSGLRAKVEHLKGYIAGLENILYDATVNK
ncbi:MAG: hypothetical protein WC397_01045 [Candidatus Paceibacterota bacterium]|jgi:predicted translin family RNA/ssDNA-binding protein